MKILLTIPKFLTKTRPWLLIFILFFSFFKSFSQANDDFANAVDVTGLINSCSADALYTTIGATPDKNAGSNWNNSGPKFNVWFKFVATGTGQINVTVDRGGSKGSQSYTQVALWESDGTTEINSESYAYTGEDVTIGAVGLTTGNTYYISVDTYNTSTDGTFTLCLKDTLDYDFYEGAIDVSGIINNCSADAIYDTRGATPDKIAGSNWNNGGPKFNRWFKFVATGTEQINVTVDRGGSKGSQSYTQVALWESDGITEINSESYAYTDEDVTIGAKGLTTGITYYISVDTYNTNTDGTFTLCLKDTLDYDFYEGAIDVSGIINNCSADAIYDTRGATPDKNTGSNWNNSGPKFNRWFKFVATGTGQINVTVDRGGSKGSQTYTQVALWESDGTTEIHSESYAYTDEDVTIGAKGLTTGNTYYISVDTYNTNTDGTFTLCLKDTVDYDFYEGAIDVTSIINNCSADAIYDTRGATPDKIAGSNWNNGGPKFNRWFKFVAPSTGQIKVIVDRGGTKGSQTYTQVALWESDGTTEIQSKHYSNTDEDLEISDLGLIHGNTYYISVDTYNTNTDGTFTLCLEDKVDYDFYEGAEDVTSLINGCSTDAVYTTIGATPDKIAGSNWNNSGPLYNRWFKFTAPSTGQINVIVDRGDIKGSQRRSQIALWESDGTTEIHSERYVFDNEDVAIGAIGLTSGNTYYISVDTQSSGYRGTFTLCLEDAVDYDFYEGAEDVTSLINSCSVDAIYDTRGATPDKDAGSNWNNSGPLYNRWFKFTAPSTGQINVTVDRGDIKGSQRRTQIALWESDGTTEIHSERYVFDNEDVAIGAIGLTSGNTYYISVDTQSSGYRGTFTLCIEDKVDYDFYEGAEDVTSLINGCSTDAFYTTIGATPDKDAGSNWNNSGPLYNRWFKFTAPTSGQINVTIDRGDIKGSQRRTQIALWESDGTTEIHSERYVFDNEDVAIGAIGLNPGNTYYISVDTQSSGYRGTFTLCLEDAVDYDFYEGAEDVTSLIYGCSTDAVYTTIGATPDKNVGSNWNNGGPLYNRWFKFTAPSTGQINVTIDRGDIKGSQRRTQIALWESDGTTEIHSERYVFDNEDVAIGAIGLNPGNTYYISVDTQSSGYRGSFTLCIEDKVDYDFYEGAEDVTSIIDSCSTDAVYTTIGATPDKIAGSNWNNGGPLYNRWFKFTAPSTGQINVIVDRGGTQGSQRRTQIALWESDGTTEIHSEIYSFNDEDVAIGAIGLNPGNIYYISVDTQGSGYRGSFTLCLEDKVDYDFYEGAEDVTSIINSCSTDAVYTTIGATPDKIAGSNWNNGGPLYNRWFKFTAPPAGEIIITVDRGGAKGSQRRTQVALWKSDGLTEISSKRYSYNDEDVVLGATGLTPGNTYYISVDTQSSGYRGTFSLCLQVNAIDFNGTDDFIDFGDNFNLTGTFSIEAWVLQETTVTTGAIVSKRDVKSSNKRGYHLSLNNGKPNLTWYNSSGSEIVNITSTKAILNNKWHHIAATYNGTTAKLYIDGVEAGSDSSISSNPEYNGESFLIGAMYNSDSPTIPENFFNGAIQEVRIWNVGLSEVQLREMMNQHIEQSGSNVKGSTVPLIISEGLQWTNLVGYYPLNNDSAIDYSGNGINGSGKNIVSKQQITAPLPYILNNNGGWDTSSTWKNGSVWNIPNTEGVVTDSIINWNIVQTSNNLKSIKSPNRNITVLGLIVSATDTLKVANFSESLNEANSGQGLRVTNYLELDGVIDLVGESQLVQDEGSILDADSRGYLERDQQGNANSYNYNYWSSSVGAIGVTGARGTESANVDYKISDVLLDGTDSAKPKSITFLPSYSAADTNVSKNLIISTYWFHIFNGLSSDYDIWKKIDENSSLKAGEGFSMKGTSGTALITDEQNYVFKGKPYNGTITLLLDSGDDRLIGNPYPSAIDAREFILDNIKDSGGRASSNIINGALYFWDHFGEENTHNLSDYVGGYAARNLIGGTFAISNNILINHDPNLDTGTKVPGQYIPVNQGFFVNTKLDDAFTGITTVTGGTVTFKNSQRVFEKEKGGTSSVFMKTSKSENSEITTKEIEEKDGRQKIWLSFDSPIGNHRQILVGVDEIATSSVDLGFDAPLVDRGKEDMFWIINDGEFVIQGVNNFNKNQEIPLGLVVKKKGDVKIQIDQLKNIDETTLLYIKDNFTGETFQINNQPFEIELEPGEYFNRFSLTFQPEIKSLNEVELQKGIFLHMNNTISELEINRIVDTKIKSINLFNSLGQLAKTWQNNLEERYISLPVKIATGVYFVQINTTDGAINKKIIIE